MASRALRDERKKNEKLQNEVEQERKELYALRELVFAGESEIEEEIAEDSIPLPYSVNKRTVVFGGHDSWARAITPLLTGNIRFVDRGMRPSPDLIRHADVIWLQANSMAHKDSYAIMNVVRTYHIAVEYFQFASAEKCVLQLAAHDQEK